MGSSITLAAVSAALAIQSVSTVPPASVALKPSGPWNVEFADGLCLLQRQFGTGEQAVTLGFKPGTFSESMRLLLIRTSSGRQLVEGEAELAFDDGAPLEIPFFEYYIPKRGLRVIVIDVKQPDLAPLSTVKQFRIQAGKQSFTLEPTVVPAAMKALDACERELLVKWGMDPAVASTITSYATLPGGLASIFRATDYPTIAIRKWEEGTSGVRFWVSKDGKARDCTIVETSGSATLDRETCSVITKRGLFEPAKTATGEAVESISFGRVRWGLPRG